MENKKNNKGLIITIIILIILLLGSAGYICYDKFLNNSKNDVVDDSKKVETKPKEDTNFYSINNLVKNHYLKEITGLESDNDRTLIKIENGKVYIVKSLDSNSKYSSQYKETFGIKGTPKYVYSQFYFISAIFVVITEEGDVYYTTSKRYEKTTSEPKKFIKLNTKKVKSLYDYYTWYPLELFTIYAEYEDNTFAKISPIYDGDKAATSLKISDVSFEKEFIYPDAVTVIEQGGDAPGVYRGLFITADRKLYNKLIIDDEKKIFKYEEIKYNNKSFKVKEVFSVLNNNDEDGAIVSYYVIDENNNIYVIKQTSDWKITSVKLHKSSKVKSYTHTCKIYDECDDYSISITYEDNSVEKMENVLMSTLYERYNNTK